MIIHSDEMQTELHFANHHIVLNIDVKQTLKSVANLLRQMDKCACYKSTYLSLCDKYSR